VVALLLGLSGCGGDADLGVPEDATPAKQIGDMNPKQMQEKMKSEMLKAKQKRAAPATP
jgi:hypothetical protein